MMLLLVIFLTIFLEVLPVSSSGNIAILLKILEFFSITLPIDSMQFKYLDHSLHAVVGCVLIIFFRQRLWVWMYTLNRSYYLFLQTALLCGLIQIITFCAYELFNLIIIPPFFVVIGFICTTTMLLITSFVAQGTNTTFDIRQAFVLALVQPLALLPGISRLAVTYAASRLCGADHKHAFQISWLIVAPLYIGAALIGLVKLYPHSLHYLLNFASVLTMLMAGMCAYYGLYFTSYMLRRNKSYYFAAYTSILTLSALWLLK